MKNLKKTAKDIWEHLADEQSKEIFNLRVMYYLTDDASYIRKTALTVSKAKVIHNRLKESPKKKLIFGAGIWGEHILETFDDIVFECFVDNYKEKKGLNEFAGKRVLSFQEYLAEYSDEMIVISSRIYNKQIYQQLIKNGIDKTNIVNVGEINDYLNTKQYFDLPQLKDYISDEEIFVDGGSLDGRSSICFSKWCNGKYKKIFAIEPDTINQVSCEKVFSENKIKNYELIAKGLWNQKTILRFDQTGNGVSHIVENTGGVCQYLGRLFG